MSTSNKKMTFDEICSDKERFLKEYDIEDAFKKSGCQWDDILKIGNTHEAAIQSGEYLKIANSYLSEIAEFDKVHSYSSRIKSTDSLIKKIITKSAKKRITINSSNYLKYITDLIGVRILYIFKDDYYRIYEQINEKYGGRFAENVHIKLRTGDDKRIYQRIIEVCDPVIEENNVYRSIHYTLYSNPNEMEKHPKLEIQTRTIFEEGWGEISHNLVYKNAVSESSDAFNILDESSKILSALVGNCDSVAMLMKTIYEEYIDLQGSRVAEVAVEKASDQAVVRNIMKKFLSE